VNDLSWLQSPDEKLCDGGHVGDDFDQLLDILGEPASAAEPGEGALDDPTWRQHIEALYVARALAAFLACGVAGVSGRGPSMLDRRFALPVS
jgi:hypothetical protein